jgi:hypothetical protein
MQREELPAALGATCVVCPHNSTPDDWMNFMGLWGSLCDVASTRRLSSTITARSLSESISLRRFLVQPAGGRSDSQRSLSTAGSPGSRKRSAAQRAEADAESAAQTSPVLHSEQKFSLQ